METRLKTGILLRVKNQAHEIFPLSCILLLYFPTMLQINFIVPQTLALICMKYCFCEKNFYSRTYKKLYLHGLAKVISRDYI